MRGPNNIRLTYPSREHPFLRVSPASRWVLFGELGTSLNDGDSQLSSTSSSSAKAVVRILLRAKFFLEPWLFATEAIWSPLFVFHVLYTLSRYIPSTL